LLYRAAEVLVTPCDLSNSEADTGSFGRTRVMTEFRLSIVIPTRNRSTSLARLLKSLSAQSLPCNFFEVIVVDDGSEPPINALAVPQNVQYDVRVIRRSSEPGAHASRFAGLREARGERILFLDDDVVLQPDVLAAHADVKGHFAVGPILYHPDCQRTAFQRYQTKRYADYAGALARQERLAPSEIYICNSSGPTNLFASAFEGMNTLVRGMPIPGDGLDEELLCHQLRDSQGLLEFLPRAIILHMDTKTVEEARREKTHRAEVQFRLIEQYPEILPGFGLLVVSHRKRIVKLFWQMPQMFRLIARLFTFVADYPGVWVPAWTCYPPLAIAYWEGIFAAAPRYEMVRAVLNDHVERS
jgi:glycosyltransferase involved in cell wall biosynthesis